MSNSINIISAIGNNSSIYPLLVRDCGIEIPTKTGLTYNQNLKVSKQTANNALRERLIDEYGTSAIWLGGIPVLDFLCNKVIKKFGLNSKVNPKLFQENKNQGIKLNIDKFKNSAPKEVQELQNALNNRTKYEKLLAGKFITSTAIPVALMGFVLPKLNFKLTDKLSQKQNQQKNKTAEKNNTNTQNISFKGSVNMLANMSTVNKMAVTDGGLTIGRVATARNKFEKLEMGFKMSAMMFLNFIAPIWIAKSFDKISNKLFNTNVNLDPRLLVNKKFLSEIQNNTLKLPEENVIEFLDNNQNEMFSKLSEKYAGVKYLKNGVRDPRAYVDEKKVIELKNELVKFAQEAKNSTNIEKYAKKALRVKTFNILSNVTLSSFLLAIALPKLTFILRKKITGSDAEPGLAKL